MNAINSIGSVSKNRVRSAEDRKLAKPGSQVCRSCFLLLTVLFASSLSAGETVDILLGNASVIHNPDISGSQGITTVNVSAGNQNQQANIGVIAIGADGGRADTSSLIIQKNQKNIDHTPDKATANITGHAFSDSHGWTAVNQVSGQSNSQANMLEIGIGGEYEIGAVNDQMLAQSFSDASESEPSVANQTIDRSASIDDTALSGMSGVIQVNQAAGTGNITGNTFVFQVNGIGN